MVFTMYLSLYILYNTLRFSDAWRLFSLLIPVGVFSLVVFHQEFLLSRCLFRPPSASNSPPPVSIKHIQQGIVIVIIHLLDVTQKWTYTEQNEQTHVQLGDNSKGADTCWSYVTFIFQFNSIQFCDFNGILQLIVLLKVYLQNLYLRPSN